MVREVLAAREEAVVTGGAQERRLICLSLAALALFAALAWLPVAWADGIGAAIFLTGLVVCGCLYLEAHRQAGAVSAFTADFAKWGLYDLDPRRNIVTEGFLVTPADEDDLRGLAELSGDLAFADLRGYLLRVLETRELTSLEYGQLVAKHREQSKALEAAARARRPREAKESLRATVAAAHLPSQPSVEQLR